MSGDPNALKERRLDQLRAGDEGVLILARVLRAERRDIVRRSDGGRRPVLTGLVTDRSATMRFTWWDPPARVELEAGTVFRAGPVSVRDYRGQPELSFNWRTRFAEAAESELPTVAVADLAPRTIAALSRDDAMFRLDARVVRVARKTVSVGEERRAILEGVLGDRTGACAFTAWTIVPLAAGEAVRLSGVRVGEFRGRSQVVLDEGSRVDRLSDDAVPPLAHWIGSGGPSLGDLEAAGGAAWVTVTGRVVGLSPPSGLVLQCPECARSVRDGRCRTHGAVRGVPTLRARVVLDDGTGTAVVNLEPAETEREWGHPLSDAVARAATGGNAGVEDELLAKLLGRLRTATGRASVDEFGTTVYPDSWGASASRDREDPAEPGA